MARNIIKEVYFSGDPSDFYAVMTDIEAETNKVHGLPTWFSFTDNATLFLSSGWSQTGALTNIWLFDFYRPGRAAAVVALKEKEGLTRVLFVDGYNGHKNTDAPPIGKVFAEFIDFVIKRVEDKIKFEANTTFPGTIQQTEEAVFSFIKERNALSRQSKCYLLDWYPYQDESYKNQQRYKIYLDSEWIGVLQLNEGGIHTYIKFIPVAPLYESIVSNIWESFKEFLQKASVHLIDVGPLDPTPIKADAPGNDVTIGNLSNPDMAKPEITSVLLDEITAEDYAKLGPKDLEQIIAQTLHNLPDYTFEVKKLETVKLFTFYKDGIEIGRYSVSYGTENTKPAPFPGAHATLLKRLRHNPTDKERELSGEFEKVHKHVMKEIERRIRLAKYDEAIARSKKPEPGLTGDDEKLRRGQPHNMEIGSTDHFFPAITQEQFLAELWFAISEGILNHIEEFQNLHFDDNPKGFLGEASRNYPNPHPPTKMIRVALQKQGSGLIFVSQDRKGVHLNFFIEPVGTLTPEWWKCFHEVKSTIINYFEKFVSNLVDKAPKPARGDSPEQANEKLRVSEQIIYYYHSPQDEMTQAEKLEAYQDWYNRDKFLSPKYEEWAFIKFNGSDPAGKPKVPYNTLMSWGRYEKLVDNS